MVWISTKIPFRYFFLYASIGCFKNFVARFRVASVLLDSFLNLRAHSESAILLSCKFSYFIPTIVDKKFNRSSLCPLSLIIKTTALQPIQHTQASEQTEVLTYKVRSLSTLRSLGNSDLSHVASVREVVIARAHVTVLPRLRNPETRRVAGGWGVVQLILKWFLICVTSFV